MQIIVLNYKIRGRQINIEQHFKSNHIVICFDHIGSSSG